MSMEADIASRADAWMQAWVRQDRALLETILAPDYELIVSAAPTTRIPRAAQLAMLDRYVATSFVYRDWVVRPVGTDMAVMSSVGAFEATIDGSISRSGEMWLVDMWRRGDEGWQVFARYSSIPEGITASSSAVTQGSSPMKNGRTEA